MSADPKALRELADELETIARPGGLGQAGSDAVRNYAQLVERLQGGATDEMVQHWNDWVLARAAINAAFRAVLSAD